MEQSNQPVRLRHIPDAKKGDTIAYRMPMYTQPTDPNQLWYGVVLFVYMNSRGISRYFVASLDYPDSQEIVHLFQVMEVIPATVEQVEDT